ncbi:hypothetical protein BC940DRAFT_151889 [Gongronella butleri]|nr:hypothetical protein BC940DRAFT_151889 [Gongronella butleri]
MRITKGTPRPRIARVQTTPSRLSSLALSPVLSSLGGASAPPHPICIFLRVLFFVQAEKKRMVPLGTHVDEKSIKILSTVHRVTLICCPFLSTGSFNSSWTSVVPINEKVSLFLSFFFFSFDSFFFLLPLSLSLSLLFSCLLSCLDHIILSLGFPLFCYFF